MIAKTEETTIPKSLYDRLVYLGIIDHTGTRCSNVGASDYSQHTIQPWSVWLDYSLDPFDADIIKRVLRTKKDAGMSNIQQRILDYNKIKHLCDERIRQLTCTLDTGHRI